MRKGITGKAIVSFGLIMLLLLSSLGASVPANIEAEIEQTLPVEQAVTQQQEPAATTPMGALTSPAISETSSLEPVITIAPDVTVPVETVTPEASTQPDATTTTEPDNTPESVETIAETTMEPLPVLAMAALAGQTYNLADIASQITAKMTVNGVDVTSGAPVDRNGSFQLMLKYVLSNAGGANRLTGADTVVYTLPGGLDLNDYTGTLYDGSTPAGTYSIVNNVITLTFSDAYLNGQQSNITGTLELDGEFDKGQIPDDNKASYVFEGAGTVTAEFKPAQLTGNKVSSTSRLAVDGTIEYTVTLNADGAFDNVELTDLLGTGLAYVAGSARLNGELVNVAQNGQTLTINAGTVDYSAPTVLTYRAKVADDILANGTVAPLTNSVHWQSGDSEGDDSTTNTVSKKNVTKTSAWADAETGLITWTITYNDGCPVDMTGGVIADTVGDHHQIVGDVSITTAGGFSQTITPAAGNKGFTYTIGANGESGAQRFTVVYQTQIDEMYLTEPGKHSFGNRVDVTNPKWPTYSASNTHNAVRDNRLPDIFSKTVTPGADKTSATWKLLVDVPEAGGITKLNIADVFWGSDSWFDGTGLIRYADGSTLDSALYTLTFNRGTEGHWGDMSIVFAEGFAPQKDIEIEYGTGHLPASNAVTTFRNSARLAYTYAGTEYTDDANAEWTVDTRRQITKTAGDLVYDPLLKSNKIVWTLVFNADNNWDGLGDADYSGIAVELHDTMPEGLRYVNGSLTHLYKKGWDEGTSGTVGLSVSENGRELTFALDPVDRHTVTLTYATTVDDALLKVKGDVTLTNDAQLYLDGDLVDTISANKTVRGTVVEKSGLQLSGSHLVTYTININSLSLDLDPEAEVLQLSDILPEDILLSVSSVKVLDPKTGLSLAPDQFSVSYDSAKRKLAIMIPDQTPVTVQYAVSLKGNVGESKAISNTASLTCSYDYTSTSAGNYQVRRASGTVEYEKNMIRVVKVDGNDIAKTLSGASFALFAVDTDTGAETSRGNKSTSSLGTAIFEGLLYDQLYYLVETAAPSGYALNAVRYYFIIPGVDGGISGELDDKIQALLPEGATYAKQGGEVLFSNVKPDVATAQATLAASKTLTQGTLAEGRFSFTLTETTAGATYSETVTNAEDGEVRFATLSYTQPGTYTYEIKEALPAQGDAYVYDTHTLTATVTVTQNGEDELVAQVDYEGATTFENAPTRVSISKVAITGGAELPGATLRVMDGTTVVEEWVSGTTPHEITAKLIAGKEYTLVEETAPNGYKIAESINFTVSTDGSVDMVEMVDEAIIPQKPNSVVISKVAVTGGAELPGATLRVMDGTTVVEEWVSGTTPHEITAKLIAGKEYTLVEETAPNGYVVAESILFTVSTNGSADRVEMVDESTKVVISKVAITGGAELPGATLRVMDGTTVVEEWISGTTPHEITAKLIAGKEYTLVEETAPDGYVVAESILFTVSTDGSVDMVEMVDEAIIPQKPNSVVISKVAVTGGAELPGATLRVMDGTTVVEEWISGTTPHEITAKLIAGKEYTLVEETAPDGYVVAESILFTVSTNGSADRVEMVDESTKVVISKVAITGGAELPGATLRVMDGTTVVEEWISGTTPHEITAKLIAGKEYTLVEETAPTGYAIARPIPFTVSTDGSVDRVEMVDVPLIPKAAPNIVISKVSISGGSELPGAHLKLMDGATLVEEWVSDGTPYHIVATLEAGKTYTLVEESAPNGYTLAEAITFTAEDNTNRRIEMVDAPTHVSISKRKLTGMAELPGATLKVLDAGGREVERWVSGDKPHQLIARLTAGVTYTLVEEAAPSGYRTAASIPFLVREDGTPQTVVMRDARSDGSDLPKTGDNSDMLPWLGMLSSSMLLMAAGVVVIRIQKRS